jgi:hypothetical protein
MLDTLWLPECMGLPERTSPPSQSGPNQLVLQLEATADLTSANRCCSSKSRPHATVATAQNGTEELAPGNSYSSKPQQSGPQATDATARRHSRADLRQEVSRLEGITERILRSRYTTAESHSNSMVMLVMLVHHVGPRGPSSKSFSLVLPRSRSNATDATTDPDRFQHADGQEPSSASGHTTPPPLAARHSECVTSG